MSCCSKDSVHPVCDWYGIHCNQEEQIEIIRLPGTLLDSTLPTELGRLNALQVLDLSGNVLRGSIPTEILKLPMLADLSLSNNLLSGSFPAAIFLSPSLLKASLGHNQLEGSIQLPPPEAIAFVSRIQELSLEANYFTGAIPPPLCTVATELVRLNLARNKLVGAIRTQFELCESLMYLDLSDNLLQGPLPTRLSYQLKSLFLDHNEFTGTVPLEYSLKTQLEDLMIQGESHCYHQHHNTKHVLMLCALIFI